MISSIAQHMTASYCFVDDFLQSHPVLAHWRHSPHAGPQVSDAEVLTIALRQGVFEVATLKQTYGLVAHNWRTAFPQLPAYQQWVARLPHLLPVVGPLLGATCGHARTAPRLYLMDSKPIPLCLPIRHGRVRLLRDQGAYFGKTRTGWFFGFKLHRLRHIGGRVLNILLTPGNCADRDPALALGENVEGVCSWQTWGIAAQSAQPPWPTRPRCCSLPALVPPPIASCSARFVKALRPPSVSCGVSLWTASLVVRGTACGIRSNSKSCTITCAMLASCQPEANSRLGLTYVADLLENPDIETVWIDESLHREAMTLLLSRQDKTYSLCDAVSFILMRQRNLTEVLTTDRHFEQEGFRKLLGGTLS